MEGDDDGDFTFPTVANAPAEKHHCGGAGGVGVEELELHVAVERLAGKMSRTSTSPLWPFSSSPPGERATTGRGGEDTPPPPAKSGRAVVQHAGADDDDGGGYKDRMDLLWEDFNDVEKKHPAGGTASDEETSGRRCGPTMLRASSRAGGAGQFLASGGTTTTGWTLLLRFFRRLLAVDKTPAPSRRHDTYLPLPNRISVDCTINTKNGARKKKKESAGPQEHLNTITSVLSKKTV